MLVVMWPYQYIRINLLFSKYGLAVSPVSRPTRIEKMFDDSLAYIRSSDASDWSLVLDDILATWRP